MIRYALVAAVAALLTVLALALGANSHALPVPGHKRWSDMSLTAKERYVRANIAHASGALQWIRTHHAGRQLAGAVRDHRRLLRKATRNLRAIEARLHPLPHTIPGIICYVWGDQCSNALAVVRCESNFDIYNQTGQYWGLFQMGEWARANYGFEWDAWQQTRGAFALYQDMGWSPWECAYIVGII